MKSIDHFLLTAKSTNRVDPKETEAISISNAHVRKKLNIPPFYFTRVAGIRFLLVARKKVSVIKSQLAGQYRVPITSVSVLLTIISSICE